MFCKFPKFELVLMLELELGPIDVVAEIEEERKKKKEDNVEGEALTKTPSF